MRRTNTNDRQFENSNPAETPKNTANPDGIDRRNFLSCMAWVGTGIIWTMAGGVPISKLFASTGSGAGNHVEHSGSFRFAQISDSHIDRSNASDLPAEDPRPE